MKKRDRAILAATTLFLLVALALAALGVRSCAARRPVTLVIDSGGDAGARNAALDLVLADFTSLYPNITVAILPTGSAAANGNGEAPKTRAADLSVLSNPLRLSETWLDPPVAWTGALWVLAARKDILDSLAKDSGADVRALRAGNATPEQFRSLCARLAAAGTFPVTLGNSHKWPFLLLLQHWTAATQGPDTVARFPGDADPAGAIARAWQELLEWKEKGWFAPGLWAEGWAKGLLPLDRGDAAFALVSAAYLGPIRNENLPLIEFLPFPRRAGDAPWTIGSATCLAVSAGTKHRREARLLVRYLTSPGVTARLTGLTGSPFFSWSPATGKASQVIPGWEKAALTPEYQALSKAWDPGN